MNLYALPPLLLQTIVWIPVRILFRLLYGFKVQGLEHIKDLGNGVIFASNHTSELDSILIPASLPFLSKLMPIFYTCREKNYYKDKRFGWKKHMYGGKLFNIWGAYEVKVGIHNYELALQKHIQIVKDGHSVCIFPEGKKNIDGKEIEPKGGAAYLSYATNTPIIPIRIDGAIGKEKITLHFGKPLYPGDIFPQLENPIISDTQDDFKAATRLIMSKIREI